MTISTELKTPGMVVATEPADAGQYPNAVVHKAVGRHLLITLKGCRSDIIDDEDKLREVATLAIEPTKATVLQVLSHRFGPQGVTVLLVLAESHASLHTYPESNVVFWDCFTCGETCDPEQSVSVLVDMLEPSVVEKQIVPRG